MLNRWSIWGFIITRIAKAQGFMDPRVLFSQIQRFSRPSEVWVPAELLRSGMVMQARGLINSQAIQNNLDWVWPFWVRRQFDPYDPSFIPRAFNITHINLTHRNWTGIGLPDCADYALVDPRGMVTPIFDGWSIDAWIINEDGVAFIPAWEEHADQQLLLGDNDLSVITHTGQSGLQLNSQARVIEQNGVPVCRVSYEAESNKPAWLMVCIRPYNTEGISLINSISRSNEGPGWQVDGKYSVHLSEKPWHYVFASHQTGDLPRDPVLLEARKVAYEDEHIECPVGMATAAAVYEITSGLARRVEVSIPMSSASLPAGSVTSWKIHLNQSARLSMPNARMKEIYEQALSTLVLYAPADVYPGPYTYKRFWFRDAAFIIHAMAVNGITRNLSKIIHQFPGRQSPSGYFESQDGEWDSNGQAIWAMERWAAYTGQALSPDLIASVRRGVGWIKRKRVDRGEQSGHAGLLPPGFSAEHLGPTDYYYWDDFWALAGLRSAVRLLKDLDPDGARHVQSEADDLDRAIEESLSRIVEHLDVKGIPASPYRRMDAGAIGSLIVSYPLQMCPPDDARMKKTVDFLIPKYVNDGAYYHELSHSGYNMYLTLQLAQALLRAGDGRFFRMVERTAELATPTGQWPEAIHPGTLGGCMGDGQHVWAAAEWVMMLRNMFVREEEQSGVLILCSGIPEAWLAPGNDLSFGPTKTLWGEITVRIRAGDTIQVAWIADWRGDAPKIEIHLPLLNLRIEAQHGENCLEFQRHL